MAQKIEKAPRASGFEAQATTTASAGTLTLEKLQEAMERVADIGP